MADLRRADRASHSDQQLQMWAWQRMFRQFPTSMTTFLYAIKGPKQVPTSDQWDNIDELWQQHIDDLHEDATELYQQLTSNPVPFQRHSTPPPPGSRSSSLITQFSTSPPGSQSSSHLPNLINNVRKTEDVVHSNTNKSEVVSKSNRCPKRKINKLASISPNNVQPTTNHRQQHPVKVDVKGKQPIIGLTLAQRGFQQSSRFPTPAYPDSLDICFFHQVFGATAKRCYGEPCTYSSSSSPFPPLPRSNYNNVFSVFNNKQFNSNAIVDSCIKESPGRPGPKDAPGHSNPSSLRSVSTRSHIFSSARAHKPEIVATIFQNKDFCKDAIVGIIRYTQTPPNVYLMLTLRVLLLTVTIFLFVASVQECQPNNLIIVIKMQIKNVCLTYHRCLTHLNPVCMTTLM